MTTDEVAEALRVCRRTVYRVRDRGHLQPLPRYTKRLMFRAEDVERLLSGERVAGSFRQRGAGVTHPPSPALPAPFTPE